MPKSTAARVITSYSIHYTKLYEAGVLGAAFVEGSRQAGVLTTAKHFPGHGDTGLDSHGRLPIISIDGKTFRNRELVPFRYLVA